MMKMIAILAVLQVVAEARRLGSSSSSSQNERGDGAVRIIAGSPLHEEDARHERRRQRRAATASASDSDSDSAHSKSRNADQQHLKPVEGNSIFGEDDETQTRQLSAACPGNQQRWVFELFTDQYAFENSWELKKREASSQSPLQRSLVGGSNDVGLGKSASANFDNDNANDNANANAVFVVGGPPEGHRYRDTTSYTGSKCLDDGEYVLIVKDNAKDGMCCQYGDGGYESSINGTLVVVSSGEDVKWAEREHVFHVGTAPTKEPTMEPTKEPTMEPTMEPTGEPNPNPITKCLVVNIQLKVDGYGEETSYDLVQIGGEDEGKVWLSSHNEVPANEMLEKEECIPTDTDYNFTITDNAQDGICCQNGDGYFRITVDGKKVLKEGKSLKHESSYVIKLGYEPEMVGNDAIWLDAHNTARLDWYTTTDNLELFTPLLWSTSLAAEAQRWAEHVLAENPGCPNLNSLAREPDLQEGENMSGNTQHGVDPNTIVTNRWVNAQNNGQGFPGNAALTQVMWRSTRYVGCGEAQKDLGAGESCHRQVCRYARTGNCAMGQGEWMDLVLEEESECGMPCPEEGCYVHMDSEDSER